MEVYIDLGFVSPSGENEGPIRRAIREFKEDNPARAAEVLAKTHSYDVIRVLHCDHGIPYCNISVETIKAYTPGRNQEQKGDLI